MMNLKDTINFKTLREKGPNSIEVKGDEVVQVVSKGSNIKVIISQEFFLNLLSSYNKTLRKGQVKREKEIDIEERLRSFEAKLSKVMKVAEKSKENKKWPGGRRTDGDY